MKKLLFLLLCLPMRGFGKNISLTDMSFTQSIIDFSIVVVGILLALFLNKLNGKRKKRKQIKNILSIISSNMNSDIKFIDKMLNHFMEQEYLIKDVIRGKITSSKKSNLNDKEIKFIEEFTGTFWKIPIEKRGYYLLKDVNIDCELKNDRLLTDIISLYDKLVKADDLVSKILENNLERNIRATLNRIPTDNMLKYFIEDFDETNCSNAMLDEQLKDKKYRIDVATHYSLIYKTHIRFVKEYKEAIEKMIKKINDTQNYS